MLSASHFPSSFLVARGEHGHSVYPYAGDSPLENTDGLNPCEHCH